MQSESDLLIDGVVYSYRCDICWQELDDTDIQFKPCNRCHLQVCLFCFDKHTNSKEEYAKTCPKCREPIDMDQIMKQNVVGSNKNSVGKKLLSNKPSKSIKSNNKKSAKTKQPKQSKQSKQPKQQKKRKRNKNKNANNSKQRGSPSEDNGNVNGNGNGNGNGNCNGNGNGNERESKPMAVDVDEEVPKCDWKNYLKGRFISRDSIIVAPVIAKFNNEEAISDNFKAYGRITRINMWDDESAHIMYDKQYFVCSMRKCVDSLSDSLCNCRRMLSSRRYRTSRFGIRASSVS